MADLQQLAKRLRQADGLGMMRFGVYQGRGHTASNSEEAIRLLCDIWNNRHAIADKLEEEK